MSTGHPSADKFAPIGAKPLKRSPVPIPEVRRNRPAKENAAGLAACWMIAVIFLGIVGWLLGDMVRLLWR